MYRSIKGSILSTVIAFAFATVLSSAARAQTKTVPVQYPIAVKLGIAFPTDNGASNNALFDAGLSYDLSKTTTDKPLIYQVYADYYGKDNANLFAIGVSAQYMLGSALSPQKPYVGLGIGDYNAHVSGSSTKSSLGGKIFAGYDFTQSIFAEVDYPITEKINDTNPDAIGVRVGYRF